MAIAWGSVALSALLIVVWIGSGWWDVRWMAPRRGMIGSREGRFEVLWLDPRAVISGDTVQLSGPVTLLNSEPRGFKWWVFVGKDSLGWRVRVPLWIPALLALLPAAAVLAIERRSRRRLQLNLCPTPGCGYDRSGLDVGARCPECGEAKP